MFSLETMGYYSDKEGSQKYPPFLKSLYPSARNFIAFVGNTDSKNLSPRQSLLSPSCQISVGRHRDLGNSSGIGLSDHWSFWKQGYPALMVTRTAFFRYHYYHTGGHAGQD